MLTLKLWLSGEFCNCLEIGETSDLLMVFELYVRLKALIFYLDVLGLICSSSSIYREGTPDFFLKFTFEADIGFIVF